MADSIEAFVQRLQQEGVQAGRAEAQKILDEARAEAERAVSRAKEQAERILAEARAEAERTVSRGREELALAARDVLLQVRRAVTQALEAVLKRAAAGVMDDKDFLLKLLHDVVVQYARKDAAGERPIEVKVGDDVLEAATAWAARAIAAEGQDADSRVRLKGALEEAGFEYSAGGGKVEVTADSVAAVLTQMISPRLRELIDQASGQKT
jgi:V/A-type H+-transporting ATPase subunit E